MVDAIGSRVAQFGSTQSKLQFNPMQEIKIANANVAGQEPSIPFLPIYPAPQTIEPSNSPDHTITVMGKTYGFNELIPLTKKFVKEHPVNFPSISLPSFSLPRPVTPATQELTAVEKRIAQLEKELAGIRDSGASNNTPQTQKRIDKINKDLRELRGSKVKSRAGSSRGMGVTGSVIKNAAAPMRIEGDKPKASEGNETEGGLPYLKKIGDEKPPKKP